MKINILGTEYSIHHLTAKQDPALVNCDGYCDNTIKRIVIGKKTAGCDIGDFETYRRKVMRHEIIHAFLFESGLHENFTHATGHDETYVDWFAVQYPKIKAAFDAAGCGEG